MNNQDEKILELQKQIEEKRKKLNEDGKLVSVTLVTNCILTLDTSLTQTNLRIQQLDSLLLIATRLNAYILSAKDLKIDLPLINGYSVQNWLNDVLSLIKIAKNKELQKQLVTMQHELDERLSSAKKDELAIKKIEAVLNNL